MAPNRKRWEGIIATVCWAVCLTVGARPGYGQTVTTGTINGVVMDAQGAVVPRATVTAIHQPTGILRSRHRYWWALHHAERTRRWAVPGIGPIASLVRPTFERFTRDDLKSRWQGKFGIRVRF